MVLLDRLPFPLISVFELESVREDCVRIEEMFCSSGIIFARAYYFFLSCFLFIRMQKVLRCKDEDEGSGFM